MASMTVELNIVDQWMALLGFERQGDLAVALGRSKVRPSQWRRDNMIPADAILDLQELARARAIQIPERLIVRSRQNTVGMSIPTPANGKGR